MMKTLRISLFLWSYMLLVSIVYAEDSTTLGVGDGPIISNFFPVDEAIGVEPDADLQITFETDVVKGAGDIVIKRSVDNTLIETISVTSLNVSILGSVVTINPTNDLSANSYYVQIDKGAFENLSGIAFGGILDNTTWNFTARCMSPTGLRVSFVNNNSAILVWNDIGVNDYQLWVRGKDIIYSTNGSTNYAVMGLTPGTTYTWGLKAKCMGDVSTLSTGPEFKTKGTNPCEQNPTGLTANGIDGNSATLSWDNMGVDDYQVWVSGGIGLIYSTNGDTSYTVTDLSPGTHYSWSLKSRCLGYGASNAESAEFLTAGNNFCEMPPTGLSVNSIDDTSATLSWDNMGVDDYQIWVSGGVGPIYSTNSDTSYTLAGLLSGTSYSWSVKSKCVGYGISAAESAEFLTTGNNLCEQSPTGLTVSNIDDNSAILSWNNMSVDDYQIWCSGGIGSIYSTNNDTSYIVTGLSPGTYYSWSIKSKCLGFGVSNAESGEFQTTGINVCAKAPTNPEVSFVSTNFVVLEWDDMGADDYQIWVSGGIAPIYSTEGQNSFAVFGLTPGIPYSWSVKSRCLGFGISPQSLIGGFTTEANNVASSSSSKFGHNIEVNTKLKTSSTYDIASDSYNSEEERSLNIYPNPSLDNVNIIVSDGDFITRIVVFDLQGTMIKQLEGINSNHEVINLSNFGPGLYFLNVVINDDRYFVEKVVIE